MICPKSPSWDKGTELDITLDFLKINMPFLSLRSLSVFTSSQH